MRKKKPPEEKLRFVKCKKCSLQMLSDQYEAHLTVEHAQISADKARKIIDDALDSEGHLKRGVGSRVVNDARNQGAIGLRVLDDLAKGKLWISSSSQSCSNCGGRVVLLEIERQRLKAFDVDREKYIRSAHVCADSMHSESIFAYSAGIVDSNRRRH